MTITIVKHHKEFGKNFMIEQHKESNGKFLYGFKITKAMCDTHIDSLCGFKTAKEAEEAMIASCPICNGTGTECDDGGIYGVMCFACECYATVAINERKAKQCK